MTDDTPIDCVGWIVVTEVFDRYGTRRSVQHGCIWMKREDAEAVARSFISKGCYMPSDTVTRTVRTCCTAFPLSAVLAGEATRWEDYELLQEIADEVVLEDRGLAAESYVPARAA